MSKTVCYIRVSTDHQDFERQAPATIGSDVTYFDMFTGSTTEGREGLNEALNYLEEGDTLVVWEMWRLGRSVDDVRRVCSELQERGVNVMFKSEGLNISANTENPMAQAMNKMILTMMAACGEFDRAYKVITIQQGVKVAKRKGVKFGKANPKYQETFNKNKEKGLHKEVRKSKTNEEIKSVASKITEILTINPLLTLDKISELINNAGMKTVRGKPWTKSSVSRLCADFGIERKRLNKHITQNI